jgi:riboflavin synthase
MFTGLIEEIGIISKIERGSRSAQISIKATKVIEDLKIGDSISTNGACLTVISFSKQEFTVDVMNETMKMTTFSNSKIGQQVNLERALRLNDRLGGHMLSGHIDGIALIKNIQKVDIASIFTIEPPIQLMQFIINKGSVSLDGISLTVSEISERNFKVSIIPHTASYTTLLTKKTGDKINLETDMIAKYLQKLMGIKNPKKKNNKQSISIDSLINNGF